MPIALANLGFDTIVVDPDARTLLGRRAGNEWDFFDYGRWAVRTERAGIEDSVFTPASLEVAVSISVIEHLAAEQRRSGFVRLADALVDGGLCVLTVDLLSDSDFLWNRVEQVIESPDVHGAIEDVVAEAEAAGLRLKARERCPIEPEHPVEGLVFVREART